jgi:hypothetical protein
MRKCYIITYDLAEGGDYDPLMQAIKDFGTWAHLTASTWAVVTEWSAEQVRDDLLQYMPDGSRILVVKSGVEAAWKNPMARGEWLRKYL